MIIQSTLMTGHKGVDLHAETAARVARRHLAGGEHLAALRRAEFHTFWHEAGAEAPESVARLLDVGRFYNPNKHHFAHFELEGAEAPWYRAAAPARGETLPAGWPGAVLRTDLTAADGVLDHLLGGPPASGAVAVDVAAFPLGEAGPLLSGVLWRLVFPAGTADAEALAASLTQARSAREGLLVNPHMQGWRTALHR
ncbi:MAG TPA: hypothetical protein P5571_13355 [Candidatus Krumholzibacteria bacterium]|nr:hypothetical protein [Candidatus Krumholzibacteria bacterium]HRX52350.1 hypothetical protein [Candidatus Krumholzibacteria bacterium]